MTRSRQLAAIMFTDIKGYTALMQQNEEQALEARAKHRRIFNATTEKYKGRILQYYGDGTLSIFDSAFDAVKCGIEMQLGFQEAPAIPVRIGIHTGDIIFSEEEIIGDSVNVASRVESLAVPGSVFISGKVYDEIKNQQTIQTSWLKTVKLKNVEKPIEVYAIANDGLVVPQSAEIKGKTEPESTPFSDQANQPEITPQIQSTPFIATKFFVPLPRPKSVRRSRLIDHLNQGLSGKMTLISAPAGFGKTSLVSQWIAEVDRPVAWLSLEERDSDPGRFLAYFVKALEKVKTGIGASLLNMLQSPQHPPFETMLTVLLNEIIPISDPFLLVLDDYHLIDNKTIDNSLTFLLEHLPPQMHLVIATREDPSLPLARMRVRGQLNEVRVKGLRFTLDEVTDFLNQAMGLNLSEVHITALENRTEGWIAGLQMAALSLQRQTDASGFIHTFTGSHHFVIDYLVEEVLQQQPEGIRTFLLQTSILNRLCGPLCNALTGQSDGGELLETLDRGNLFLIPLDEQRLWYRYHHLFAEVIQVKLQKDQPAQVPTLHMRASQWFEESASWAEAIYHAFAGNDFDRAAGLIELAWPEMDGSFQTGTWLKWIDTLPDGLVINRPVLLVGLAWAYLNEGNLETGEIYLKKAERCMEGIPGKQGKATHPLQEIIVVDKEQFRFLPGSIATARAYLAQAMEDQAATLKYAQQALDFLPEEEYLRRGPAAALLSLVHWASGDLDKAFQALSDAMLNFQLVDQISFTISGTYGLADIRMTQGRLRETKTIYKRSLQLVAEKGDDQIIGTADLYLGLGDIAREQGDLKSAIELLQKSEALGESVALPDWKCRMFQAKARLNEAQGDLDEAIKLLHEAEQLYYRTPVPNARPIETLRAKVWLRQDHLAKAKRWAKDRRLSAENDLNYLNELDHITFARLLLSGFKNEQKEPDLVSAIKLLDRLSAAAEAGGRMGNLIEILILKAIGQQMAGNIDPALIAFERALTLAEPEGYIRIFVDEGPPVKQLLETFPTKISLSGYISRLLSAFANNTANDENQSLSSTSPTHLPLIEPLSQRELEILQLIAQGRSNKEISQQLYLALSTVKGHNRNIFGKLAVERRTEAVARAQELGLI